jgi:hypothetical protein
LGVTNQTGMNAAVTPEHLHFAIQDGGSSPNFVGGGNVCPYTDFKEKFGLPVNGCEPWGDCVKPLTPL